MSLRRLLLPALLFALALSLAAQPEKPVQPAPPQEEKRMTPKEAEELFRSVDLVLKWVRDDTRFPVKEQVKRRLATRKEVMDHFEERMRDDEDTKRMERSELVVKKFGLLPRDFELEHFLVGLLGEQVAGYYDFKTKTVYLLDWIAPESQRSVLAHELTHALQDQNYNLEKWSREGEDAAQKSGDINNEVATDEVSSARTAVVEGQGMIVMLDYLLAPAGKTVLDSPQYIAALVQNMTRPGGNPVFDKAPMLLRESLVFPYKYGITFEMDLLAAGSKPKAFAGAFTQPPRDTHEVMVPQAYLAGKHVDALRLPRMSDLLPKRYAKFDVGAIGQFDSWLLLKQYTNEEEAERLSTQWLGGAYYAAQDADIAREEAHAAAKVEKSEAKNNKSKGNGQARGPASTRSISVLFVSRWKTSDAAQRFAADYAKGLAGRYAKVTPPEASTMAAAAHGAGAEDFARRVAKKNRWMTDEGPVYIEVWGQTALVMESFDDDLAAKLRQAVLSEPDTNAALEPLSGGELGIRFATPAMLRGAWMKFALDATAAGR